MTSEEKHPTHDSHSSHEKHSAHAHEKHAHEKKHEKSPPPPQRVTLTSTFRPRDLLCIDRETKETRFIEPKVPEGISLRNFGIQVVSSPILSSCVRDVVSCVGCCGWYQFWAGWAVKLLELELWNWSRCDRWRWEGGREIA